MDIQAPTTLKDEERASAQAKQVVES